MFKSFTFNHQPKREDFNFAPSAVFAIYYGVEASPIFNTARPDAIKRALHDFTNEVRANSDYTIIEVWRNGKVKEMQDALEQQLPKGVVISLLAN